MAEGLTRGELEGIGHGDLFREREESHNNVRTADDDQTEIRSRHLPNATSLLYFKLFKSINLSLFLAE